MFMLLSSDQLNPILRLDMMKNAKNVLIIGGGNIGLQLAKMLEKILMT